MHYCKVCGRYKANEKFSGGGHANHICKECSKLPPEVREEKAILNRIYSIPPMQSKAERKWLESLADDPREAVRAAVKKTLWR